MAECPAGGTVEKPFVWVPLPKFDGENLPSVLLVSLNFEPVRTAERLSTGWRITGKPGGADRRCQRNGY